MPTPARRAPSAEAAPVARLTGWAPGRAREATPERTLDLSLPRGSFHIVTGGPGSGKSALLETLALAARPARGGVEVLGRDPWAADEAERARLRRRIGWSGAFGAGLSGLTVRQSLILPLALAGERPQARAGDVAETLSWLGLEAEADTPLAALPFGPRRAAEVGRALIGRPDLILLDEPFEGVDEGAAARLHGLLAALAGGEAAVVLAQRTPPARKPRGARLLRLDGGEGA